MMKKIRKRKRESERKKGGRETEKESWRVGKRERERERGKRKRDVRYFVKDVKIFLLLFEKDNDFHVCSVSQRDSRYIFY